jgi:hypothetical protein
MEVVMKQFNTKFPEDLAKYLEFKRDEQDVNISALIRRMVAEARDREIRGGTYKTETFSVTVPEEK